MTIMVVLKDVVVDVDDGNGDDDDDDGGVLYKNNDADGSVRIYDVEE